MPLKLVRRGDIWHYRGTVAGRRLRGSTRTADKATAERIAAETEARAWKSRLDGPDAVLTFAQAAILYRQAGRPTRFLDRVEDWWRDTLVRDITAGAIRNAAAALYPNAGPATRNRHAIVPTAAIINHAAGLGLCNPVSVKRFRVETREKEPVTLDWIDRFCAVAAPKQAALALFMFATGARVSEALALDWADVDLAARTARIRQTKIGDERIAHLPPRLVVALANLPERAGQVIRYSRYDTAKQTWTKTIARAGLPHRSFHACRHGFATSMLHAGVDPVTVARLGGWKDTAQLFRTYGHARDDRTVTNAIFDTPVTQATSASGVTDWKKKEKHP